MLYTGKGDKGTTKVFGCDQRISKSSAIAEALGSLDEINSFLGLCKVRSQSTGFLCGNKGERFDDLVHEVQENLFIIQAELAGAKKKIAKGKVTKVENIIDAIEKELPPIKTFFISGGTELTALFDVARTLARRAERRVVAVAEADPKCAGKNTLAYLNRLSSLLYALARLSNHKAGVLERAPQYR